MNKFFSAYYFDNGLIPVDALILEKLMREYSEIKECYLSIYKELDALNILRSSFMSKYKYVISYHPYYMLYNNIKRPDISLYRRKEKYLNSTMSFSIASKSKAILVSFEDDKFVHIPQILEDKKTKVITLKEFQKKEIKLFHTNNPTSTELNDIIEILKALNEKLNIIFSKKIPFTILENALNWSLVFFSMRETS